MRNSLGFTSVRTIAFVIVAVGVGFAVTRIATSVSKVPTAPSASPGSGGLDNAMEQARRLLAELRENDWNVRMVDQSLLRLPEQDYKQAWAERQPHRNSFTIPRGIPEFDEVALYSDTFVNWVPRDGKSGDSTREGYYIVAWMDGRINTVDVRSVRYYPVPGSNERDMYHVFPGMDEYEEAYTALPGTREWRGQEKAKGGS